MKVRIQNQRDRAIRVVLEPWAYKYILEKDDFIDFVSEGENAENGFFLVEDDSYAIIVTPEGKVDFVQAYNSKGEAIV